MAPGDDTVGPSDRSSERPGVDGRPRSPSDQAVSGPPGRSSSGSGGSLTASAGAAVAFAAPRADLAAGLAGLPAGLAGVAAAVPRFGAPRARLGATGSTATGAARRVFGLCGTGSGSGSSSAASGSAARSMEADFCPGRAAGFGGASAVALRRPTGLTVCVVGDPSPTASLVSGAPTLWPRAALVRSGRDDPSLASAGSLRTGQASAPTGRAG